MLLRRVIEHVKEQNWTAVVIDFVIVVLGVFMGIQVQGAYQNQRDQELIEDYLHRMHADVVLSIQETQNTKKFVAENLENLLVVISSTTKCAIAEDNKDTFANGLYHLGKTIPAQFVNGTLTELRASGRLLLLKNSELREAINEAVRVHEYIESVWRSFSSRAGLHRDYVDSKVIYLFDRPSGGFSKIKWNEIDIEFETVCNDREFISRLSSLQRSANVNIDWLDRSLKAYENLKTNLENELKLNNS
jgi:hypothetical protein